MSGQSTVTSIPPAAANTCLDNDDVKHLQLRLAQWRKRLAIVTADADSAARVAREVTLLATLLDASASDLLELASRSQEPPDQHNAVLMRRFERCRAQFDAQLDDLERRALPLRTLREAIVERVRAVRL